MPTMSTLRIPNLEPLVADATGSLILGLGLVFVVFGLVGVWYLSRSAPRGTVLAVAIAIYAVGFLIPKGDSRLLHGVAGFASLFGIVAGVLGVVDLVRKRQPTESIEEAIDAELIEPAPAPQQIQCPRCQRQFKHRPELAGKKVKCPCGEMFLVPAR